MDKWSLIYTAFKERYEWVACICVHNWVSAFYIRTIWWREAGYLARRCSAADLCLSPIFSQVNYQRCILNLSVLIFGKFCSCFLWRRIDIGTTGLTEEWEVRWRMWWRKTVFWKQTVLQYYDLTVNYFYRKAAYSRV